MIIFKQKKKTGKLRNSGVYRITERHVQGTGTYICQTGKSLESRIKEHEQNYNGCSVIMNHVQEITTFSTTTATKPREKERKTFIHTGSFSNKNI